MRRESPCLLLAYLFLTGEAFPKIVTMHVCGRKSSRYGLLAALLAAALLATAISQKTSDAQQQQQEQQPDIAEVTPYKLTQIPGCEVAEGDGYELPAGVLTVMCQQCDV